MKIPVVIALCLMLALGVALSGCTTKVTRVETEETIDLSGRWNDTDSRLVSEELIRDALQRQWLPRFEAVNKREPVVIVGSVANRTTEHISVETFVNDLERELLNSGQVKFVAWRTERGELRDERQDQAVFARPETAKAIAAETGADFMLLGSIDSIIDRTDKKAVVYYQVELELIELESNVKVWIGQKKIKKFVKRPRYVP